MPKGLRGFASHRSNIYIHSSEVVKNGSCFIAWLNACVLCTRIMLMFLSLLLRHHKFEVSRNIGQSIIIPSDIRAKAGFKTLNGGIVSFCGGTFSGNGTWTNSSKIYSFLIIIVNGLSSRFNVILSQETKLYCYKSEWENVSLLRFL